MTSSLLTADTNQYRQPASSPNT